MLRNLDFRCTLAARYTVSRMEQSMILLTTLVLLTIAIGIRARLISRRSPDFVIGPSRCRQAKDKRSRPASLHRLELIQERGGIRYSWSLFITGPVVRTWGFHCENGWVPWRDFVDERDTGKIGRGCGEQS